VRVHSRAAPAHFYANCALLLHPPRRWRASVEREIPSNFAVRPLVVICLLINVIFKPIRRKRKSPIRVPQTPSAFHPHAQRNAFRRRGVRQHSRSFARWNQSLRRSPNSNRRCSDCQRLFPNISRARKCGQRYLESTDKPGHREFIYPVIAAVTRCPDRSCAPLALH
jgi:hypothetical protein